MTQLTLGAGAAAIFIVPGGKSILVSVTNEDKVVEVNLNTMEVSRQLTGFKGHDAMGWIGD